jgi:transcription elongation factor Elf1
MAKARTWFAGGSTPRVTLLLSAVDLARTLLTSKSIGPVRALSDVRRAAESETKMPLTDRLSDVDLTFNCPHCGHPLIKPGKWFKSANRFKCSACQADVRLTYSAKVALFARYDTATEERRSPGGKGASFKKKNPHNSDR